MKRIILAAAAATTVISGAAAAQQAHGSIGAIVNEGFDDLGAVGRVGYDITPNFGVEGELGYFSVGDDEFEDLPGVDVDADVFTYIAFAKAQAPVSERFSVFGRLGYGGVTLDVDVDVEGVGSESDSETEGAFAYGVGAEFAVTPNGAIRADYTRIDLGDFDDEGFLSLAYTFRFGGVR